MPPGLLESAVERGLLFRSLRAFYRRRFTPRGRFLFWASAALALVGADTRRSLVYILFCLAAPPLVLAVPQLLRRAPRLRIGDGIPARLSAGRPLECAIEVAAGAAAAGGPLSLQWDAPLPDGLEIRPAQAVLALGSAGRQRVPVRVVAHRRGRFELPSLLVARTDAFALLRSKSSWQPRRMVLAYPRYFTLEGLELPLGRRYQPGGIPLASEVGDSLEFVGTREYRPGDPLRKIDWRSWARRARPVVKEFQEEYFSRIALVLDTFLPRRPSARERRRFEAAISTLASVAEHFSRSEEVVDILAAGPDLYEVSTGRSLGYLDNVLDVLSCLEPCAGPPFETIGPVLYERLGRLTTVIAVMLEWDAPRAAFLRRIRDMGVSVRVWLVHEGETRSPWHGSADLGELTRLTPEAVEDRLAAEERA